MASKKLNKPPQATNKIHIAQHSYRWLSLSPAASSFMLMASKESISYLKVKDKRAMGESYK